MFYRRTGAVDSCAAVDEDGFGKIAPSLEHRVQLIRGKRRPRMVGDRNVPHLKAGGAVDAKKIAVGIKAEMLVGQQAHDGDNSERLGGFNPALDFTHAYGRFAATGISGARRAVKTVGKDCFHKCQR